MKSFFENVKTTLFGAVAGLPMIFEGIEKQDVPMILTGLGMLLVGIFAKDAPITQK